MSCRRNGAPWGRWNQRLRKWVGGSVLVIASATLAAQSLPPSLDACTRIAGDKERLECFDREAAALAHRSGGVHGASRERASPAPKEAVAAAGQSAAAAHLTPEQKFGLSLEQVRRKEENRGEAAVQEMHVHVTRVSGSPESRYVFVLDNGQVWRQAETKPSFSLHPGALVTVGHGALGSFWISTGPHNSTRVERVQ